MFDYEDLSDCKLICPNDDCGYLVDVYVPTWNTNRANRVAALRRLYSNPLAA